MPPPWWPSINAFLNLASAAFLLAGRSAIRRGNRPRHRRLMFSALASSVGFLLSYLLYHLQAGSVRFQGVGMIRTVYFLILGCHTVLALLAVPLVSITLLRALGERFDSHKRIARWTHAVWVTVSISGIIVFLFLYVFFPAPRP